MTSQTIPSGASINAETALQGGALPKHTPKDRSQFLAILQRYTERAGVDVNSTVLVVGGTEQDADVLRGCGLSRITLSNIEGISEPTTKNNLPVLAVDAESSNLPDNSYDMVFVHEAIHHCRCPHRALCEMLRVARRYVIMMEPNDSAFMRLLCWSRFSFPFEIAAVVDNDYTHGGVRNSQIPNFIYRWNRREVDKAASSFLAEYTFRQYTYPYWDFNVNERDLAYRAQTRISKITSMMGGRNFIKLLRCAQAILNRLPILRDQGNKFFCAIEKSAELKPWLLRQDDRKIVFNRDFQHQLGIDVDT